MTIQNWNPDDFKLDFPTFVTPPNTQLKDLPFIHKVHYLFEYVLERLIPEALIAILHGASLGGLFIALATIDYLAGFFVGKETKPNDYQSFMYRYFPDIYLPYLKTIYSQIRCGLMHNLVAISPWKGSNQIRFSIQERSLLHLVEFDGKLSFSIPVFIEDTRRAFIEYQYDLIMKPRENKDLVDNFNKRFNKVNGRAAVMVYVPDRFTV